MTGIRWYRSPLGGILLAADADALIGLWFEGQKGFAAGIERDCREIDLPVFDLTLRWLDAYFGGDDPGFTPPLAPCGTPFSRAVWRALTEIPYGHTATYGDIAGQLAETGMPRACARAVGGAVGRNPISVIIPCHRVLGAGGRLTGYAGGLDRKWRLLALEGVPGFSK